MEVAAGQAARSPALALRDERRVGSVVRAVDHAAAVAGDPLADVKEQPAPGLLVAEGTAAVRPDRQRDPLLLIRTLNFIGDGLQDALDPRATMGRVG